MSISKDEADYLRDLCRERKAEIEKWRQQQKEDYATYLEKVAELTQELDEQKQITKLLTARENLWLPKVEHIQEIEGRIDDYDKQLRKVTGWLNSYKERVAAAQTILQHLEASPMYDSETFLVHPDLFDKLRETLSPKQTEAKPCP